MQDINKIDKNGNITVVAQYFDCDNLSAHYALTLFVCQKKGMSFYDRRNLRKVKDDIWANKNQTSCYYADGEDVYSCRAKEGENVYDGKNSSKLEFDPLNLANL